MLWRCFVAGVLWKIVGIVNSPQEQHISAQQNLVGCQLRGRTDGAIDRRFNRIISKTSNFQGNTNTNAQSPDRNFSEKLCCEFEKERKCFAWKSGSS